MDTQCRGSRLLTPRDTLVKVGRPAPSDQQLMAMQAAFMRLLVKLRHLSSLEWQARSLASGRPPGIKS
jgi:hypothetical protein